MKGSERQARAERTVPSVLLVIWETVAARRPGYLTFLKFVVVGAAGYLIYQASVFLMYDSPLLWVLPAKDTDVSLGGLHHSDVRLLITTLVAAELSIIGVFLGHNHWTFRNRDVTYGPIWLRFLRFNLKALVSTIGIMTLVVNVLILRFDFYHFTAVPLGALAAFVWNWLWDVQYIWRRNKTQ